MIRIVIRATIVACLVGCASGVDRPSPELTVVDTGDLSREERMEHQREWAQAPASWPTWRGPWQAEVTFQPPVTDPADTLASLSGLVVGPTDLSSLSPDVAVPYANVVVGRVGEAGRGLIASDAGRFTVGDLVPGSYTVKVDHASYSTVERVFDLRPGQSTMVVRYHVGTDEPSN